MANDSEVKEKKEVRRDSDGDIIIAENFKLILNATLNPVQEKKKNA